MDYGKYLYQKDKASNAAKKKQKQIQIKEIKFRPTTEDGDYQTKLRSITRFLDGGDKVKIVVRFRGREMAHQELGMEIMDRLKTELAETVVVEQHPRMEGRQSVMVRSEEHTSELQSLMRISYVVLCLKKKRIQKFYQHIIISALHIRTP